LALSRGHRGEQTEPGNTTKQSAMYVKQTHLIPPEIEHKESERGRDIRIEFDRQYGPLRV
jgi:hypothetical protein